MRGARRGSDEAEAAYDAIAEAWAKTRSGPWPEVTSFLHALPRGALVADVGGGSGRYLQVPEAKGLRMVIVDVSRGQLAVAARAVPGSRLARGDARAVPMRGACADGALLVAVIHHFEAPEDRGAVLRELHRVLRPGARGLISAWGTDAEDFRDARKAPGGGPQDFLVEFKAEQPKPVDRFFHAYAEGELRAEALKAGFPTVREWTARDNRFVEVMA